MSLSCWSAQGAHSSAGEKHEAGMSKISQYATTGYFIGGDRSVKSAKLKDIRRGPQKGGVERIVFDLQSADQDKAPYFQVNISPNENRLLLSIWADVTYEFDADKIKKAFTKSGKVKFVNVIPRVEDGIATIELTLKSSSVKVEAFHLAHPARIILDLL